MSTSFTSGSARRAPARRGCITGCTSGFGTLFKAKKPKARPSSFYKSFQPKHYKGVPDEQGQVLTPVAEGSDTVNNLIKEFYPYLLKWFEKMMREEVEPRLQKLIREVAPISISFEKINISDVPLVVKGLAVLEAKETSRAGGEDIPNVLAIGEIDHTAACEINVKVTGGSATLQRLHIQGTIVLELVKLKADTPWFSGLRVYFTDKPKLSLDLSPSLFGFNISQFSFIKERVVSALGWTISTFAVLPNRFCVPISGAMDMFELTHPAPQGILRVRVVSADGLKPDKGWKSADPYVELTVGATTERTPTEKDTLKPTWKGNEAVKDFEVTLFGGQLLVLEVRDAETGWFSRKKSEILGRAERTVADLVGQQERGHPVESSLPLRLEGERFNWRGSLKIETQWRPYADLKELRPEAAGAWESGCWDLGDPDSASWRLSVDVFYATGLPPAEVPCTQHWVHIEVKTRAGASQTSESDWAACDSPQGHAIRDLQKLGVPPESARTFLNGASAQDARRWQRREASVACSIQRDSWDVEWNEHRHFFLDSLMSATITFSVRRPTKNRRDRSSAERGVDVSYVEYRLEELLNKPAYCSSLQLPLKSAKPGSEAGWAAQLRCRLQVCPLMEPPSLSAKSKTRFVMRLKTMKERSPSLGSMLGSLVSRGPQGKSSTQPTMGISDKVAAVAPQPPSSPPETSIGSQGEAPQVRDVPADAFVSAASMLWSVKKQVVAQEKSGELVAQEKSGKEDEKLLDVEV